MGSDLEHFYRRRARWLWWAWWVPVESCGGCGWKRWPCPPISQAAHRYRLGLGRPRPPEVDAATEPVALLPKYGNASRRQGWMRRRPASDARRYP
jgi:hypothetical protein